MRPRHLVMFVALALCAIATPAQEQSLGSAVGGGGGEVDGQQTRRV